jgi:hypothetical protein
MLREYPQVVRAVFLHKVSSADASGQRAVVVPPPKIINGRPLVFFRTYVGAAAAAVQLGLMSLDGLQCVIDAATRKLANEPRSSDRWMDVERDIERANALLAM